MSNQLLIDIKNLKKHFPVSAGPLGRRKEVVKSVDGVSFGIYKGETFGLVGESGCGKSTLGRVMLRLLEPTEGEVFFQGESVSRMNPKEFQGIRKEMQLIFQDPYASLNPRMTIGKIVEEPMRVHTNLSKQERSKKVRELLDIVGIREFQIDRYPHEFSGGQRQRIGIARALSLKPKFIVCDEPVSALDVSIQSQVINLLEDLQVEFNLTYLFVAHDLAVVRHISDRVGVMYLGKIVELSPCDTLFDKPLHPYTKALLSAIPVPNPKAKRDEIILEGDVPSPFHIPTGCRFHTRCPLSCKECQITEPEFTEVSEGHFVACHRVDKKGNGHG